MLVLSRNEESGKTPIKYVAVFTVTHSGALRCAVADRGHQKAPKEETAQKSDGV
jgi:hypothetical protein